MALVKGTLSRSVWEMFFVNRGLNKKSFLFEALTVLDLQWSLEAQAFKICLLKLFAVRSSGALHLKLLRSSESSGSPRFLGSCT